MLNALLILMIGFVGGVAVTVALGVGLYRLAGADEQEMEPFKMAPRQPQPDPPTPCAPAYKGFHPAPLSAAPTPYASAYKGFPPAPQPGAIELEDWRS